MTKSDPWLTCDACNFSYLGGPQGLRAEGERCGDMSWLHSDYPTVINWPIRPRGYRAWWCRGRVWPSGSAQLRGRKRKEARERLRRQALVQQLWERNLRVLSRTKQHA